MAGLSVSSPAIQQLIAFAEAVCLGMFFALCHDLYRALRMQFRRPSPALSVILDCLFWIAAAVAAILFLVHRRWGEVHIYVYVGLAGGFALYLHYLSGYLLPLLRRGCALPVRLFRPPAGRG